MARSSPERLGPPAAPRVAYATAPADPSDPDPDLDAPVILAALREAGVDAAALNWDDPAVDWRHWDAVLIRSTWNYQDHLPSFLAWTDRVASVTQLLNPAPIVAWNTDKAYLQELAASGVPTVPTAWHPPGRPLMAWPAGAPLAGAPAAGSPDWWVVKPAVGAGARGVGRFPADAAGLHRASRHVHTLHTAGLVAMVQPYLPSVETTGEAAIVVIDGRVSHAVRKVPALTEGGHGDARGLTPVTAPMREVVAQVAGVLGDRWAECAYARIDVVATGVSEDRQGSELCVLECELVEPLLFCFLYPAAATALVAGVLGRLTRDRRTR